MTRGQSSDLQGHQFTVTSAEVTTDPSGLGHWSPSGPASATCKSCSIPRDPSAKVFLDDRGDTEVQENPFLNLAAGLNSCSSKLGLRKMATVLSVYKNHLPTSGFPMGTASQLVRERRTSPFSKTTKFKGLWPPHWLLCPVCKSGANNRLMFLCFLLCHLCLKTWT